MTPLECAVDNDRSDTVYYFINKVKIDITKFNEVILANSLIFCVLYIVFYWEEWLCITVGGAIILHMYIINNNRY